jgi:hypothetical protein
MVDHELLTLAARAAGITLTWPDGENDHPRVTDKDGAVWIWNPCDFDGDAFRLALDANITVDRSKIRQLAITSYWANGGWSFVTEDAQHDLHAATRLAITRAAAAISKTMKE